MERSGPANAHAIFADTESVTLDTIDFPQSDREELRSSQHQTPRRHKIRTQPRQIILLCFGGRDSPSIGGRYRQNCADMRLAARFGEQCLAMALGIAFALRVAAFVMAGGAGDAFDI